VSEKNKEEYLRLINQRHQQILKQQIIEDQKRKFKVKLTEEDIRRIE